MGSPAAVLANLGCGCVFKSQWADKWDDLVGGGILSPGKAPVTGHLSLNLSLNLHLIALFMLMHT